jgi:hypothetical protein
VCSSDLPLGGYSGFRYRRKRQFADEISPKEDAMSQTDHTQATNDPNEPVPFMQQLLDNPFLLLFLGVMVPMVVYTLWGVIDILTVPLAK